MFQYSISFLEFHGFRIAMVDFSGGKKDVKPGRFTGGQTSLPNLKRHEGF